jgi:DNA polymerase-1
MLFFELEFRRMAEQFDSIFKRTTTASKSNDDDDSSKSPNKSEDQFDLLEVEFQMNLQKKTTILQNTTGH